MNENINLCEVLKDCPEGTHFWSPLYGDVSFLRRSEDSFQVIVISLNTSQGSYIEKDAHIIIEGNRSADIMLYPSKEQRDWSKWKCPKSKKPKFDPKTLQPFDKVLVRDNCSLWCCGLFSRLGDNNKVVTVGTWDYAVPYNNDTKHLVGTKEEAPEFYRYWED